MSFFSESWPAKGATGDWAGTMETIIEEADQGFQDLQTGALPIALPGIAGALPQYGPLRAVRTPFEFGGVGDGVTDDYDAVRAAYEALPATGGVLDLAGRRWMCGSTLTLDRDVAVTVDGGALGSKAPSTMALDGGGGLIFPLDIDGVIVEGPADGGVRHVALRNLSIATTQAPSTAPGAGTGNGLTIRTNYSVLDNVAINGFKGDGLYIGWEAPEAAVNANLGVANSVTATWNGGNGIHLISSDANVWQFNGPNVVANGEYGIKQAALFQSTFLNCHAAFNTLGDYYDNSWSSVWMSPYSESEGKFVVGVDSRHGFMHMGLGGPKLWYDDGDEITEGFYLARNYGWTIFNRGQKAQFQAIASGATTNILEYQADAPNNGWYTVRLLGDPDTSKGSLYYVADWGGVAGLQIVATYLSFFGATLTTQPAANADTSGATLGQLETEVNELKGALRTLGLIAT